MVEEYHAAGGAGAGAGKKLNCSPQVRSASLVLPTGPHFPLAGAKYSELGGQE